MGVFMKFYRESYKVVYFNFINVALVKTLSHSVYILTELTRKILKTPIQNDNIKDSLAINFKGSSS